MKIDFHSHFFPASYIESLGKAGYDAVEMLGYPQLTGWFAKAHQDQRHGHHRPGNALFPFRQQSLKERDEIESIRDLQAQPATTEVPYSLYPYPLGINFHPFGLSLFIE